MLATVTSQSPISVSVSSANAHRAVSLSIVATSPVGGAILAPPVEGRAGTGPPIDAPPTLRPNRSCSCSSRLRVRVESKQCRDCSASCLRFSDVLLINQSIDDVVVVVVVVVVVYGYNGDDHVY